LKQSIEVSDFGFGFIVLFFPSEALT